MGNPPDVPTDGTVPCRPVEVKCNAATPADNSPSIRQPFFSWRPMRLKVRFGGMEFAMRMIGAVSLVAVCGMLACAPARADWVPPFKGNDTGGIIAYSLANQTDARQLAVDHCARYDKVVKFLAVQAYEGGYLSFACRWVPYGAAQRPLRTLY
jgi:hypothetical protein